MARFPASALGKTTMLQRLIPIFCLEDLLIGAHFTRLEVTNLVPGTLRCRRRSGDGNNAVHPSAPDRSSPKTHQLLAG